MLCARAQVEARARLSFTESEESDTLRKKTSFFTRNFVGRNLDSSPRTHPPPDLHQSPLQHPPWKMSRYDRRRVNGPPSYVPVYDNNASTSNASGSTSTLTTSAQRPDGRAYTQLRPIFLQTNLVPSASGSSYVEIGDLKLACSVFGPRQVKGRQYSGKAELNVEVKFAPFSSRRRRQPGKVSSPLFLSRLMFDEVADGGML